MSLGHCLAGASRHQLAAACQLAVCEVVRQNQTRTAVPVTDHSLSSSRQLTPLLCSCAGGAAPAEVFLLVAARAGDAETVEELLAAGADPLCTDQQGRTALQLAVGGAARKMLAAAARAAPKAQI